MDDLIIFGDWNRPNLQFLQYDDNPIIYWPCNLVNDIDYEFVD
jgi:hypothetical protein